MWKPVSTMTIAEPKTDVSYVMAMLIVNGVQRQPSVTPLSKMVVIVLMSALMLLTLTVIVMGTR